MKEVIGNWPEFRNQKSKLDEIIEAAGHVCMFSPKFHCELVSLERIWERSKYYCRKNCRYTWASLKEQMPISLSPDVISPKTRVRFYRKARDYVRAYRAGLNGPDAFAEVKKYSSHHRTPKSELLL
ncbi:unnamed protein product [Heterosigma akashiwo]